jgi:membrane protein DedA with SNARE-associated domain
VYDAGSPYGKNMDLVHFFEMILHVDKTLELLIQQYGTLIYVVLFAIIFAETGLVVLFFFPGDTLLFIAGALCAVGELNLPLLMVLLQHGQLLDRREGRAAGVYPRLPLAQ